MDSNVYNAVLQCNNCGYLHPSVNIEKGTAIDGVRCTVCGCSYLQRFVPPKERTLERNLAEILIEVHKHEITCAEADTLIRDLHNV